MLFEILGATVQGESIKQVSEIMFFLKEYATKEEKKNTWFQISLHKESSAFDMLPISKIIL